MTESPRKRIFGFASVRSEHEFLINPLVSIVIFFSKDNPWAFGKNPIVLPNRFSMKISELVPVRLIPLTKYLLNSSPMKSRARKMRRLMKISFVAFFRMVAHN